MIFMDNLVFDKWPSQANITDMGLQKYINLDARIVYYSQGRIGKLKKENIHIIERLINNLMRGGTGKKIGGKVIRDRGGCGKRTKMEKVVMEAFEIIEKKEKKNPLELLVSAVENAAPREETTRVKYGGIVTPIAVDVAPQRRVDFALRNMAKAVAVRSFNNPKSAATALAEEILLAAKNENTSHAISRRNEVERTASSSR